MRIGRYRITKRGYVVFGSFGLIILCLIIWLGVALMPSQMTNNDLPNNTKDAEENTSNQTDTSNDNQSEEANGSSTEEVMSVQEINDITKNVHATVYFEPDKYDLDETYYKVLQSIIDTSIRFKNVTIVVEGHFNSEPSKVVTPFRVELAQNRADVVVAYLVSQGIDPSRIETVNMENKKPVNRDESWEEISKNRRVTISIQALTQ